MEKGFPMKAILLIASMSKGFLLERRYGLSTITSSVDSTLMSTKSLSFNMEQERKSGIVKAMVEMI